MPISSEASEMTGWIGPWKWVIEKIDDSWHGLAQLYEREEDKLQEVRSYKVFAQGKESSIFDAAKCREYLFDSLFQWGLLDRANPRSVDIINGQKISAGFDEDDLTIIKRNYAAARDYYTGGDLAWRT